MMSDEIFVNERDKIIEVVSSGVLTRQDMERAKTIFQEIFSEKGIDRIFIDTTRLESAPSVFDIFEVFATLPIGFKLAILVTPSSPIINDVTFAGTVGSNRGTTVKICLDQNEARQWLSTFRG